jgi:DNA invertase Pin-like site-specific DNA recombinase
MLIGYARVSSDGQSLDSQVSQLKETGCTHIFQEKVSGGSRANRAELSKALRKLSQGDVLVVSRLDRLARSSRDLLNVIGEIAEKGALFRSLGDTWADTTTAHGRLILTVLGGLAEFERELIKARTSEGRARARKDGIRFGRPRALNEYQRREAIRRRENGESLKAIASSYRVSAATIFRLNTTVNEKA